MARLEATVSVDKAFAAEMKDMATELGKLYGLYVTNIEFDWQYNPMQAGNGKVLHKVIVTTESN